ncbi:hypothetical protein BB561_005646 [Smittium simulii]|uniref:Uncharacterized protein n=1 Tax=Smittium simulii TaxID=133385 RepID=A0A2T9Y9C4_9FUNG|nr:hypothetical protein BB561_005646 [Smittium simulii]
MNSMCDYEPLKACLEKHKKSGKSDADACKKEWEENSGALFSVGIKVHVDTICNTIDTDSPNNISSRTYTQIVSRLGSGITILVKTNQPQFLVSLNIPPSPFSNSVLLCPSLLCPYSRHSTPVTLLPSLYSRHSTPVTLLPSLYFRHSIPVTLFPSPFHSSALLCLYSRHSFPLSPSPPFSAFTLSLFSFVYRIQPLPLPSLSRIYCSLSLIPTYFKVILFNFYSFDNLYPNLSQSAQMVQNSSEAQSPHLSKFQGVLRTPKRSRPKLLPYSRSEKNLAAQSGILGSVKAIFNKLWGDHTPTNKELLNTISNKYSAPILRLNQYSQDSSHYYDSSADQSLSFPQNNTVLPSALKPSSYTQASFSPLNNSVTSNQNIYFTNTDSFSEKNLTSSSFTPVSNKSPGYNQHSSAKINAWMSPAHAQRILNSLNTFNDHTIELKPKDLISKVSQKQINPIKRVQELSKRDFLAPRRSSSLTQISSSQSLARIIQQNHAKRILERFNNPEFLQLDLTTSKIDSYTVKNIDKLKNNLSSDNSNTLKRQQHDETKSNEMFAKRRKNTLDTYITPRDASPNSADKSDQKKIDQKLISRKKILDSKLKRQKQRDLDYQNINWRFSAKFLIENPDSSDDSTDDESMITVPSTNNNQGILLLSGKKPTSIKIPLPQANGPKRRPFYASKPTNSLFVESVANADSNLKQTSMSFNNDSSLGNISNTKPDTLNSSKNLFSNNASNSDSFSFNTVLDKQPAKKDDSLVQGPKSNISLFTQKPSDLKNLPSTTSSSAFSFGNTSNKPNLFEPKTADSLENSNLQNLSKPPSELNNLGSSASNTGTKSSTFVFDSSKNPSSSATSDALLIKDQPKPILFGQNLTASSNSNKSDNIASNFSTSNITSTKSDSNEPKLSFAFGGSSLFKPADKSDSNEPKISLSFGGSAAGSSLFKPTDKSDSNEPKTSFAFGGSATNSSLFKSADKSDSNEPKAPLTFGGSAAGSSLFKPTDKTDSNEPKLSFAFGGSATNSSLFKPADKSDSNEPKISLSFGGSAAGSSLFKPTDKSDSNEPKAPLTFGGSSLFKPTDKTDSNEPKASLSFGGSAAGSSLFKPADKSDSNEPKAPLTFGGSSLFKPTDKTDSNEPKASLSFGGSAAGSSLFKPADKSDSNEPKAPLTFGGSSLFKPTDKSDSNEPKTSLAFTTQTSTTNSSIFSLPSQLKSNTTNDAKTLINAHNSLSEVKSNDTNAFNSSNNFNNNSFITKSALSLSKESTEPSLFGGLKTNTQSSFTSNVTGAQTLSTLQNFDKLSDSKNESIGNSTNIPSFNIKPTSSFSANIFGDGTTVDDERPRKTPNSTLGFNTLPSGTNFGTSPPLKAIPTNPSTSFGIGSRDSSTQSFQSSLINNNPSSTFTSNSNLFSFGSTKASEEKNTNDSFFPKTNSSWGAGINANNASSANLTPNLFGQASDKTNILNPSMTTSQTNLSNSFNFSQPNAPSTLSTSINNASNAPESIQFGQKQESSKRIFSMDSNSNLPNSFGFNEKSNQPSSTGAMLNLGNSNNNVNTPSSLFGSNSNLANSPSTFNFGFNSNLNSVQSKPPSSSPLTLNTGSTGISFGNVSNNSNNSLQQGFSSNLGSGGTNSFSTASVAHKPAFSFESANAASQFAQPNGGFSFQAGQAAGVGGFSLGTSAPSNASNLLGRKIARVKKR